MDVNAIISTLLSSQSVSGVSKSAKATKSETQSVLSAALPMLLSGAQAQAQGENTALSFAKALLTHGSKDTSDIGGFLKNVDMADGAKIIGHLLGSDSGAVEEIADKSGVSQKKTGSILSAAAPLLMSLLGQDSSKDKADDDSNLELVGQLAVAVLENVDVGELIGGLFGGADGTTKKAAKTKKAKAAGESGSLLGVVGNLLTRLLK